MNVIIEKFPWHDTDWLGFVISNDKLIVFNKNTVIPLHPTQQPFQFIHLTFDFIEANIQGQ